MMRICLAASREQKRKKHAAMSFLENALATVDAVATRKIVNPEKFRRESPKSLMALWSALMLRLGYPKIANCAILRMGQPQESIWTSADFFAPGFEVLFYLGHELVGYRAVDEAVVVT